MTVRANDSSAPRFRPHWKYQSRASAIVGPAADRMPGPSNTLLIEGSFEELADELSHYIDEVKRKQGDNNTAVQTEITPLLEKNQKDDVLKKLVTGSAVLNSAPEKGETRQNVFSSTLYFCLMWLQKSSLPTIS